MLALKNKPPKNEKELLEQCQRIEGLSFAQLALELGLFTPVNPVHRKGWVGQALELALGADAKNESLPDFKQLGIELKTIPINKSGKPAESTFIVSIPLPYITAQ